MRYLTIPRTAIGRHDAVFTPFITNALQQLVSRETDAMVRAYYEFLLDCHQSGSFAVIKPGDMEQLIRASNIEVHRPGFPYRRVHGQNCDLYRAIDYGMFGKGINGWTTHVFIDLMNIGACPYCNAVSIRPSPSYPPLDHYFPHARFPFLGLSIFNLVPVCGRCNGQSCKGEKYLPISCNANPYCDDVHSSVVFRDRLRRIEDWSAAATDKDLELDVYQTASARAGQAEHFLRKIKVLEAYNIDHKTDVQNFIEGVRTFSDMFLRDCNKRFSGLSSSYNPRHLNRRILMKDDIRDEPLSKYRIDLCDQYNIPKA